MVHRPRRAADLLQRQNRKLNADPLAENTLPSDHRKYRNWSSLNDDVLVAYAQNFLDKSSIRGRKELSKKDPGLYVTLRVRKMLGRIKFKADRRSLDSFSDSELIRQANLLIENNGIKNRYGLDRASRWLSALLRKRGLMDQIDFKEQKKIQRNWSSFDPDGLVAHAQNLIIENAIPHRQGLVVHDHGLYKALKRRKLLERLRFQAKPKLADYSDDQLVSLAQKFVDENSLMKISYLQRMNKPLYSALLKRDLIGRVAFKEIKKEHKDWGSFSDEEMLEKAQTLLTEKGIKNKHGLSKADYPLYRVLKRRNLLEKIKFEKTRRNWSSMSDEDLISHAVRFIQENKIERRSELSAKHPALCSALQKRKLMQRVFHTSAKRQLDYQELAKAVDLYTTPES
jgi:hypothetical protein